MSASVKKQSADRGGGKGPKNPPTTNAWNKPLAVPKKQPATQPPPGMLTNTPPPVAAVPKPQEMGDLRGRFINLLLTLTGQKVTITLLSGETISGVLHTVTPFPNIDKERRNKYVLKGVEGKGNYVVDMAKVAQLHVPSCRLESSSNNTQAFTDAEIAAAKADAAAGHLVQADASWTAAAVPLTSKLSGSIDGWDQFKANETLFNVKSGFDESIYTTVLDRSQVSSKDKKKAEQLAREIESSSTQNMHQAEERNQVCNQDYDEEDRYSGVLKQSVAPKLNYAQAAAGKEKATAKEAKEESKVEENGMKEASSVPAEAATPPKVAVEKETEPELEKVLDPTPQKRETNSNDAAKPSAPATADSAEGSKSKLNAKAKEFSFNVNASEFKPPTPTQPQPTPPHPPQQVQHPIYPHQPFAVDPNTGMPIMMPPNFPMQHGFMNPMMHQFPAYGVRIHPQFQHHQHLQHPHPEHSLQPQQVPDQQRMPDGADSEEVSSQEGPGPSQPHPTHHQPQHFPGANMQHQPGYFPVGPYMPHQPQMHYPPVRPPVYMYYDEGNRSRRGSARRGGGRVRRGSGRGSRTGGRYFQQNQGPGDSERSMNGQAPFPQEMGPPPDMAPPNDNATESDMAPQP